MRASATRRFRSFMVATGLTALLALITAGVAVAGSGPGPWPK
jgi:hypothetical protein